MLFAAYTAPLNSLRKKQMLRRTEKPLQPELEKKFYIGLLRKRRLRPLVEFHE